MCAIQRNYCQICFSNEKQLVVDHNAQTGIVRGLLCAACNLMIGIAKHNRATLQNADKYLEENEYGNNS